MKSLRLAAKKTKAVVAILVAFAMCITSFSMAAPVYGKAGKTYDTLSERTALNQKMYDLADNSHRTSTVISRYQDKSLKDMHETKEKGMTAAQQTTVKNKANEIIAERKTALGKASLTQYEMLKAFHDWIVENFYFYEKVNAISADCDNPYYLLTTEYNHSSYNGKGKIRSRCNGYTATFIAFARSQGIPARAIGGHYIPAVRKDANNAKWTALGSLKETHQWSQAYVDSNGDGKKEWIVVDCNADCWNSYSTTSRYTEGGNYYDKKVYQAVRTAYFNVSAKRLAQSHVILDYRPGSKDLKYLSNTAEKEKLKAFLNIKYNGKTNGKRINASYTTSDTATWFTPGDTKSLGDGNGKLYKLYWPAEKGLYGKLDLSGFTALQNIEILKNKVTGLYLKNCSSLKTVSASGNSLTKVDTTGSKNLTLLSIQGNPTTSVKYTFNSNKTANIDVAGGGTVSVKYSKTSAGKHQHTMSAFAKSGYVFKGWFNSSGVCVSKSSKVVSSKTVSFDYTARFAKALSKVSTPTVAKSGTKAKVSWKGVSGADGYHVAQCVKKNGAYVKVKGYYTTSKSKLFAATKGKTYHYKVRAYDKVDGIRYFGNWSNYKSHKR